MNAGFIDEARAWRDWLLRAVAGDPAKVQILYGVGGRAPRSPSTSSTGCPGYAGSRPVRIGNAAHEQFQLDVYGEVMDALHQARVARPRPRRARVVAAAARDGVPRRRLGPARRGDLGGARAAAPLHALEGAGVGRRSTARVAGGRALRAARPGRPLAPAPRRDPRRGLPRGLQRRAELVHAGVRLDGARRLDAADPAGRLPAARRPARGRHGRRDPAGPDARRVRRALPDARAERRRRAPGGEGVFLPCSFWLVDALLDDRPGRRGARALRAAPRRLERPRAARRGVRPVGEAAARELPAGVHARRSRQLGVQPLAPRQPASPTRASRAADARPLHLDRGRRPPAPAAARSPRRSPRAATRSPLPRRKSPRADRTSRPSLRASRADDRGAEAALDATSRAIELPSPTAPPDRVRGRFARIEAPRRVGRSARARRDVASRTSWSTSRPTSPRRSRLPPQTFRASTTPSAARSRGGPAPGGGSDRSALASAGLEPDAFAGAYRGAYVDICPPSFRADRPERRRAPIPLRPARRRLTRAGS